MSGGQNETPRGCQADTGQVNRFATAAGTHEITQGTARAKRAWSYLIIPEIGDAFAIQVKGRVSWALDLLREAGPKGCTPIDQPAPRWSAYIHTLRRRGVGIETVREPHGGEFPGYHGRYVLCCKVLKGGAA